MIHADGAGSITRSGTVCSLLARDAGIALRVHITHDVDQPNIINLYCSGIEKGIDIGVARNQRCPDMSLPLREFGKLA